MASEKHEVVAKNIVAAIIHDINARKGFPEHFGDLRPMQKYWEELVLARLPDGLSGTSPRDRLPASYVDNQAPVVKAAPAGEVLDL